MKLIHKPKMWISLRIENYPPVKGTEKYVSVGFYDEKAGATGTDFNEAILWVLKTLKEKDITQGKKTTNAVMLKIKEYFADTRMTGKQKTIFVNSELDYCAISKIIIENLTK